MNCKLPENLTAQSTISEIFNYETYYTNSTQWFYFGIDAAEFLFLTFSTCVVSFGFKVFLKMPVFHQHLMKLIYSIILFYYGVLITRVTPMFIYWFNGYAISSRVHLFSCVQWVNYLEYLRFAFIGSYLGSLQCIIIERLLAIIYLETYESQKHKWIMALCVLIEIISGVFVFICLYQEVSMLIMTALSTLSNIVAFIFFTIVELINKRLHCLASKTDSYALSQRYQISENVRTSFVLKRVALYLFFLNLIIESSMTLNVFSVGNVQHQITTIAFNWLVIVYSISLVLIFLTGNEIWRKQAKKMLGKMKKRVNGTRISHHSHSSVREAPILKTINGLQMNFKVDQEFDIYFKSLEKSWGDTLAK